MKYIFWVLVVACLLVCVHSHPAFADTTTINNKGMPVPSAMAPSMSAFSQDKITDTVTNVKDEMKQLRKALINPLNN